MQRLIASAVAAVGLAVSMPVRAEEALGSLVIIGGGLRVEQADVWKRIVALAGGPGTQIAVFPTASGFPARYGNRTVDILNTYGANAFLIPLSPDRFDLDAQQVARDTVWADRVQAAGGVYFIGGKQSRITSALLTTEGERTPLLEAVWQVYRKGGVICGTSAGAAIMSQVMFREPPPILALLQGGLRPERDIGQGLGFLPRQWFVDQHALVRGRFARSLLAMQGSGSPFGVAIDENTALVVEGGGQGQVIGYKGAVVLDVSHATCDVNLGRFNLQNARVSYVERGDRIDLGTVEITPSAQKLADRFIDPTAGDFRPTRDDRIFTSDILGNTTLLDVLVRLVENRSGEAVGLAFDGAAARQEAAPGFEFRFYRTGDTKAWYTEAFGGEDYTVANVSLDVRPVEISGPLYR